MATKKAVATVPQTDDAQAMETVLLQGDLGQLNPEQRINHYLAVCKSLNLNHLTKPFDYIRLNGKLQLYVKKDATEQLRRIHNISLDIVSNNIVQDVCIVTARATMPDGRTDTSTGAVSIKGLVGEALANAFMKAETKAKRRVTLSISGLGFTDESEVDSIPNAQIVDSKPAENGVVDIIDIAKERDEFFAELVKDVKALSFDGADVDSIKDVLKNHCGIKTFKISEAAEMRRCVLSFFEDLLIKDAEQSEMEIDTVPESTPYE